MQLNCPSCESRFVIDSAALGAAGRKVRCGHCGHTWHAERGAAETGGQSPLPAPSLAPEPVAPEDTGPDDPTPKPAAFDETRQRSHAERRRPPPEKKRRSDAGGWLLFAAVVAVLVAGVFFGRQQIMAWAPETAELYAIVGLASADPASVLELELVSSERRLVDGEQTLFIEGRIVNSSDRPQDVPPLVATLTGSGGAELKRWTFSADADALEPGGSAAFQTSAADPPHLGELDLNLDFASVR